VKVLKGRVASSFGELLARKGLVVFQFALSVILILAVWVVYQQVEFVQNKNLGFDKENVVTFPIEGKVAEDPATFLTELERIPGILNVTSMQHSLLNNTSGTVGFYWEGKNPDETVEFKNFTISQGYFETFGIPLVAGRGLSNRSPSDLDALVLNQTAVDIMGLTDPIGAKVNLWGNDKTVVGVVGDFHFESMQEGIKPALFKLEENDRGMRVIAAKIAGGKERETLAQMEEFYKTFNPGGEFNIKFLDAEYQALYVGEERVSMLSRYFAGLAILISCLGLYGLAAFSAERRTKEIGIRKTLGASEWGIVAMLSGDFTKLVLIAIVLALPLSFYLIQVWLEQYAFKIELQWWYFTGAGLLTLLIALLTVSFQSVKAALMNPVESLRSE
jgi:putative ABC transport system permease protein